MIKFYVKNIYLLFIFFYVRNDLTVFCETRIVVHYEDANLLYKKKTKKLRFDFS